MPGEKACASVQLHSRLILEEVNDSRIAREAETDQKIGGFLSTLRMQGSVKILLRLAQGSVTRGTKMPFIVQVTNGTKHTIRGYYATVTETVRLEGHKVSSSETGSSTGPRRRQRQEVKELFRVYQGLTVAPGKTQMCDAVVKVPAETTISVTGLFVKVSHQLVVSLVGASSDSLVCSIPFIVSETSYGPHWSEVQRKQQEAQQAIEAQERKDQVMLAIV